MKYLLNLNSWHYRIQALLISVLFLQPALHAQHQRTVVDNGIRFLDSDSSGMTSSYISNFGDSAAIPPLLTIEGKTFNSKTMIGKTVVYNFWFTSCKPCVAEIPALNMLAGKYKSDTVLFIAITFDEKGKIDKFLETTRFDFQIVHLPMADIQKFKKVLLYP